MYCFIKIKIAIFVRKNIFFLIKYAEFLEKIAIFVRKNIFFLIKYAEFLEKIA